MENQIKVGDKVLAKFKRYNTSVFEGIIEEIKGDDIAISTFHASCRSDSDIITFDFLNNSLKHRSVESFEFG